MYYRLCQQQHPITSGNSNTYIWLACQFHIHVCYYPQLTLNMHVPCCWHHCCNCCNCYSCCTTFPLEKIPAKIHNRNEAMNFHFRGTTIQMNTLFTRITVQLLSPNKRTPSLIRTLFMVTATQRGVQYYP